MEEEYNDILNAKIGDKEKPNNSIKPAKVMVKSIGFKTKKSDGTMMKIPLVELEVKHPDVEDTIKISKVKQLLEDKVFCSSTWLVLEESEDKEAEKKIQKDTPLSRLMAHARANSLTELVGKELDTEEESKTNHFLVFKAY